LTQEPRYCGAFAFLASGKAGSLTADRLRIISGRFRNCAKLKPGNHGCRQRHAPYGVAGERCLS
jgi:hypothetical protein